MQISSLQEADMIKIEFIDNSLFFNFAGIHIDEGLLLGSTMQTQFQFNDFNKLFVTSAEVLDEGATLAFSGNFIINIFLNASLSQLWQMI